MVESGLIFT